MATVQKKPRKLPKIPKEDPPQPAGSKSKGDGPRQKELPPPARKRDLPPLKRTGKREMDTKSMVEMGRKSPVEADHRTSLTATTAAKSCFFYIDDDYRFGPVKMVIHPKKHRKMETVTRDLSVRMKSLPFGVRSIFTPRAKHRIHNLEDLTQDGHYVCSSNRKFARGMDVQRVNARQVWHNARPDSGKRSLVSLLKEYELHSAKQREGFRQGYDLSRVYTKVPPKKVTVMRNGEPYEKHMLLLNRRTAQTFEQVMKSLSENFKFAVKKLYTIDGVMVDGLNKILNGPDHLVAAGLEPFIPMGMEATSRARTRMSNMGSQMNIRSRLQSRRDKLAKTKGRWMVTVRTNALPSAGTQAQVTITVYGTKGNSGPCTLGHGDGTNFQPGQVDEFEISVGNVGEVYKVRLAHDNSGDFPGWLCDEVHMVDRDTGEELSFNPRRWLARDEDDQEITRELAVKRPGEPILPLIKYQVDVYTGDLWGGGTDANVYITIYGDRGDTGVRQLYTETKGVYFKQGQMDSFEVEAVSLGHLKRIIVGHDGTGPGSGWFLDKIVIREPPFRPNQEHVFHCGKWLDEGEDDGKIVRELRVQDEYMDDILEKRNWEYERWKFDKECQVKFYSVMTGKALRVNKDNRVDGVGEEKDQHCVFNVIPKKPMKPMFAVSLNPNNCLAIDGGNITGAGKGGPFCEFRVRVQQDRTALLESVKNPLQFITIGANGAPGDVRGILDKEPSRRFHIYSKGVFRHRGIVMLCTSLTQCINLVKEDDSLTGRGKRSGPLSQFRVHKVSSGGIRMFESIANPGRFIRLKDGKIDCLGGKDDDSHFLVLRHKDKGYITLQAASQRGLFIGMTQEGKCHTTIDTGVRNIWLYPEVVEWGMPKKKSTDLIEEDALQQVRRDPSPVSEAASTPAPPAKQFAEERVESVEVEEIIKEEGDWSVQVSTLSQLTNGDVAIVCYGDRGDSGPIVLGAPPGKPIFQSGNDDEFRANLLKIGKMYKIRLELLTKISTREPSWKVKEVKMQDLNNEEVLTFTFNRWLSRQEDDHDIMRELPVVRPGENVLPVHKYEVSVYTGKEMGSETDAQAYINLFGERGDWGKRYLMVSNNNNKFRVGQVDVFYIEAVSLGSLQRCVIGHDGTGDGQGWYVEKVVVKESKDSSQEYVFKCDRWLDTGKEDRKIERTLMVQEPGDVTEKPTLDKYRYNLEIVTDPESSPPKEGKVHITLYGEKKKSDQIVLYASDPNSKTFEPGNVDTFMVETEDLGELYKIRIGRDDSDTWDRWGLGEVRLTNEDTKEKIVFVCNRWLARDMDDGDLCRELPVIVDGRPRGVTQTYQINIYTGDHWGASTDANVYITVHGTRGDSGKRLLHKGMNNRVKFRRGQMDTFEVEAVNLEELTSVVVSHDGHGHGAGLFLDKVVIREKESAKSHLQYVFPCSRWLDDHEDDCLTERTLRMIDINDASKPPRSKESKRSSGNWTVTVKTSSLVTTAPTSNVFFTVYGTNGKSQKHQLSLKDEQAFAPGTESNFVLSTDNIGRVTKMRLEHDNSGSSPDWKVDFVRLIIGSNISPFISAPDNVKMTDNDTNEELVFYLDRWLAMDQDDGQICREVPVVRKGTPGLSILRYVVAITTGGYKDAGIENGNVSLNLIGVDGDTGLRELAGPISKNRLPWQSGQTDIYVVEAVSVGNLKKIELNFIGAGQDRWYVETIDISEGTRASSQFVCYCHQWLLSTSAQVAEFPVSEIQPSTALLEEMEAIPRGFQKPVKSKGSWTVYIQTGTQNDSGTTEKVCLVLCGLNGESEPVRINAKDGLNPGSLVKFEAKAADIGLMFKVRVFFEEKHVGSSWFLAKMKLKDTHTGEELHFEHNDWIESSLENPEGATELPVIRPDMQPLKEQIYIVSVKTGSQPLSETSASLYCNLIGQWGSTGVRSLSVSSQKDMYRAGQMDSFTLTCIDLGEIEKVIIGHDTPGRGQGWFCESVSVKVAEESETLFPCNRWLDTGCDDRQLKAELKPLAKLPESISLPTKYVNSKGGKWNFHITYASKDRLSMLKPGHKAGDVSIVVYGYNSVKGPLELSGHNQPVKLLSPGKTEHFYDNEMDDIGAIEKIRVSSGYEGDTENVWTIQQVVLEDQTSQEMLTFDFRSWVGEMGGDIRKEMPLVLPNQPNRQVVQYYIEVYTSEAEMNAATNSNVFVTLYGSNSDSGRRHLIKSQTVGKRFQPGQVDKFVLEAVDLGDLEKLVVAKGPGKPWLLDKIVVKRGEFAEAEHVFMFNGWIGDKQRQDVEIEEKLQLTSTIPSHVAVPIQAMPDIQLSEGSWIIEGTTGGRRGPEGPLDLVVVFGGQEGETKPLPLLSEKDNTFQIGQTDTFKVKYDEKIGDLRKVRLGFADQSVAKAWYVRKIAFEDQDNHDVFSVDLNEWIAIDNKMDGWKEFPVPWPAIQLPKVLTYVVSVKVGTINSESKDSEIYLQMFGDHGNSGRRLLKHSLSNTEKIRQNQVDVFEIEAVDLGDLIKIIVGHKEEEEDFGWFLDYVQIQESQEDKGIVFACNNWIGVGGEDPKTERTLYPSDAATYQKPSDEQNDNINNSNANEVFIPLVATKSPTPTPEPIQDQLSETEAAEVKEVKDEAEQVKDEPEERRNEVEGIKEDVEKNEDEVEEVTVVEKQDEVEAKKDEADEKKDEVTEKEDKVEDVTVEDRKDEAEEKKDEAEEDREPTPEVIPVPDVTADEDVKEEETVEKLENEDTEEKTEDDREKKDGEEEAEENKQIEYEPTPEPSPVQSEEEGTRWSVTTMTGGGPQEGTGRAILLILYGDKGHSSPCILGEKEDFMFRTGNTDNFNLIVKEDIGDIFKVRIGFVEDVYSEWCQDPTEAPSWFLSKLTLRNDSTMQEYEFEAGIWVTMNEAQDYWRELPVKDRPDNLDVLQYQVLVVTSAKPNAGFDGSVFLQIVGDHGDTGYRRLMASQTHEKKFVQGNRDLFEIGAVNLGQLSKICIKHDKPGHGSDWLLDSVVIQESDDSNISYVFKCGGGLDKDETELALTEVLEGDKKDEEEEQPQQEDEQSLQQEQPDEPGEAWTVQTMSGGEGNQPALGPVELVLYDVTGYQQSVMLGDQPGFSFKPNATDVFNVRVQEELQRLYKVRLGFHNPEDEADWFLNNARAPVWYLKQLTLTHEQTGQQYEVQGPSCLQIEKHQDYWREQPVLTDGEQVTAVYQYQVEICTGDQSEPGTDVTIYLNIYGEAGDTGMRRLMASKSHSNRFERGHTDLFELNAVDLGLLTNVKVTHEGNGPGWYIDRILVKESEDSRTKYVFNCDRWQGGEDGGSTVTQEFPVTDVVKEQEQQEEPQQQLQPSGHPWTVSCVTGTHLLEDTDATIDLVLYGNLGHSAPVAIGDEENFSFSAGQKDEFQIRVDEKIGDLYKVRVGFHGDKNSAPWYKDYNLAPTWFVEKMSLKDETTGTEYQLDAGLSVDVEQYTDFWRELPVVNTGQPLDVHRYQVEVHTGAEEFVGGADAIVMVQIFGERGDTGARRLMNSITNDTRFLAGQKDEFEVPAVDLGELTKVKVTHASVAASSWLLDRIVVKESDEATVMYVFECSRAVASAGSGEEAEVTLTLTDVIEVSASLEETEPKSEDVKDGDWKVLVTTGSSADSGTDSNVILTVYGDADNSAPLPLGSPSTGYFYSGQTDEFDVFIDPENIGQIRKIRLEHDNSGKAWNVEKVVMVNKVDGSQIEFLVNKWLTLDQQGFDIAVEVPTQGHDWPVRDYVVRTETGDGFGSGTDAQVYVKLVGTIGDTGKRCLVHNLEEKGTFESGQLDTFIVQAVDLGRLIQVQIGHNGQGPGSGWFLKQVQVKESMDAPETYIFKCEQWFHDEKGDGLTERLLTLDKVDKDPETFLPVGASKDILEDKEDSLNMVDKDPETFPPVDTSRDTLEDKEDNLDKVDQDPETFPPVDTSRDTMEDKEDSLDKVDKDPETFPPVDTSRDTLEDKENSLDKLEQDPETFPPVDTSRDTIEDKENSLDKVDPEDPEMFQPVRTSTDTLEDRKESPVGDNGVSVDGDEDVGQDTEVADEPEIEDTNVEDDTRSKELQRETQAEGDEVEDIDVKVPDESGEVNNEDSNVSNNKMNENMDESNVKSSELNGEEGETADNSGDTNEHNTDEELKGNTPDSNEDIVADQNPKDPAQDESVDKEIQSPNQVSEEVGKNKDRESNAQRVQPKSREGSITYRVNKTPE